MAVKSCFANFPTCNSADTFPKTEFTNSQYRGFEEGTYFSLGWQLALDLPSLTVKEQLWPELVFGPLSLRQVYRNRWEDLRMQREAYKFILSVALSLAVIFCGTAVGQVLKGSISGTVTDPQGAVITNAQVKATNTATGV